MTESKFLNNDKLDVFSFGHPPVCIDLFNCVKGVTFEEVWKARKKVKYRDIRINIISKKHLIQEKKPPEGIKI